MEQELKRLRAPIEDVEVRRVSEALLVDGGEAAYLERNFPVKEPGILPDDLPTDTYSAKDEARRDMKEECAKVAEHLNGWGWPLAPKLADHIAACIRAMEDGE